MLWQTYGHWKEAGGCGGKDGVPRAGLLRFHKCHCGALCQLHKQAAISASCIVCPLTVSVWGAGCTCFEIFYLCGEGQLSMFVVHLFAHIHTVTFTYGSCTFHYCLPPRECTDGSKSLHLSGSCWIIVFYLLLPSFQKKHGSQVGDIAIVLMVLLAAQQIRYDIQHCFNYGNWWFFFFNHCQ